MILDHVFWFLALVAWPPFAALGFTAWAHYRVYRR